MANLSITTTLFDTVFAGDVYLETLTFKNGSSTGTIYLRNKRDNLTAVSSTNYDYVLTAGEAIGFTKTQDGKSMRGPWSAISDTGGGVTLVVLPGYSRDRRL